MLIMALLLLLILPLIFNCASPNGNPLQENTVAWRIPGTEEPVGLPSMGSHRVGHDRRDLAAAAAPYYLCTYLFKTIWQGSDWVWNVLYSRARQIRVKQIFSFSWSEVAQLCPALCDPMNCSLPGSFVREIFQARVLEWVAISFSRGCSQPRDWTWVSRIAGRCFTIWATR